jgi:hypothetical protein
MNFMKTAALFLGLFILSNTRLMAQTKDPDVTNARLLAKHFYNKGEYLNAYKFLLIYKYSHLDSLQKPACKNELQSVNNAIAYSEKNIKTELAASNIEAFLLKARGFKEQASIDSMREVIIKNAPRLE